MKSPATQAGSTSQARPDGAVVTAVGAAAGTPSSPTRLSLAAASIRSSSAPRSKSRPHLRSARNAHRYSMYAACVRGSPATIPGSPTTPAVEPRGCSFPAAPPLPPPAVGATMTVWKASSFPSARRLHARRAYHEQSSLSGEYVTYAHRAHSRHRPTQSANERTRCARVFHEPLWPLSQLPSTPSLVTPQNPVSDTLCGQSVTPVAAARLAPDEPKAAAANRGTGACRRDARAGPYPAHSLLAGGRRGAHSNRDARAKRDLHAAAPSAAATPGELAPR